MSGAKYIADTSALINLLKQHSGLQPLLNATWHYCFITEIELLGKPALLLQKSRSSKNFYLHVLKYYTQMILQKKRFR